MKKTFCDACGDEVRELFVSETCYVKGGYLQLGLQGTETTVRPDICRQCVIRILTDEKHPMRELLEKKP